MEVKDQKSLTIDDILDELVKPSVIRTSENPSLSNPLPSAKPQTPSLNMPVKPKPEVGSSFRLPSLGWTEDNKIPSPERKPSEISLSIRTMATDLKRLKMGQKPTGLAFQKSTIQPLSKPVLKPDQPVSESQVLRPPQFGKEELSVTSIPPLAIQDDSHKLPERVISKDSLPSFPGASVPKSQPLTMDQEKIEYKAIAKVIGSGMTTGILSAVAIAVVVYALFYFFVLTKEKIIVETPLPTFIRATKTPEINNLENIFRSIVAIDFSIPANPLETVHAFKSFIGGQSLAKKEFRRINLVLPSNQTGKTETFRELLGLLSVSYPTEIESLIKNNFMVLIYGNSEPDSQGSVKVPQRVILIVETENSSMLLEVMRKWESTMANDLAVLFDVNPNLQASQAFLDNQHEGTSIRYKNFPMADKSVDYAIVSSPAGRHYLLLTNSREAMYSPAEKIKGL